MSLRARGHGDAHRSSRCQGEQHEGYFAGQRTSPRGPAVRSACGHLERMVCWTRSRHTSCLADVERSLCEAHWQQRCVSSRPGVSAAAAARNLRTRPLAQYHVRCARQYRRRQRGSTPGLRSRSRPCAPLVFSARPCVSTPPRSMPSRRTAAASIIAIAALPTRPPAPVCEACLTRRAVRAVPRAGAVGASAATSRTQPGLRAQPKVPVTRRLTFPRGRKLSRASPSGRTDMRA